MRHKKDRNYTGDFERDFEDRVDAKRRRLSQGQGRSDSRRERDKQRPKAPLLLRVLAWCGVVMLCFVLGYVSTSYMLDFLDRRLLYKGQGSEQGGETALLPSEPNVQKAEFSLYYPKDGTLTEERVEVMVRIQEDSIQETVSKLLSLSGFFARDVTVKHVFRNVDTVYLDLSGAFLPALNAVGARPSTLFITGVVRTMRDNFPPITKVRFLVDSKVTSTGAPVDLTAVWQLPK
ncbi:MAG: GerMN domain-containing protein [Synergistaceae bacterium]|nr:GerMN domain-containing protein [Synergistaceae bacterium]